MDSDTIVYLNVGGVPMAAFLKTLTKYADSKLAELFTTVLQPRDFKDESSPYFMDRNGKIFAMVINYLSSDYLTIPNDPVAVICLRQELAYWKLPAVTKIQPFPAPRWISAPKKFCHVHIFMSGEERIIEWDGGKPPDGLHRCPLEQVVKHFGSMGYRITSQFGSKAAQPLTSLWMVKEEPNAQVENEVGKKSSAALRNPVELKEPPPVPSIKNLVPSPTPAVASPSDEFLVADVVHRPSINSQRGSGKFGKGSPVPSEL